jgi:hypothetical protein
MAIGASDNEGVLARAMREMNEKWESTASVWRDKAREEFDKEYIEEFTAASKAALHAMRGVEELLRQVDRDCGG